MPDRLPGLDPRCLVSGASLSDDGRYRWALWRRWDFGLPPLGFIMLNPSTADATEDDPTIRRCLGFAKRDGYGGIKVANLFGLRATDPSELDGSSPPVGRLWPGGPAYDPWVWMVGCRNVVAGWGAAGGAYAERVAEVLTSGNRHRPLTCLGTTKDGHPRHPLYVRGDQPLARWTPPIGGAHA